MLSRLPKLLVVFALTFSLGLHWMFLQSAAWVGMIITYSQTAPISEAVAKTFDGKHPCPLCKFVQKNAQSEKSKATQKTELKLEFCLDLKSVFLFTPPSSSLRPASDFARPRADVPLLPPPRAA